MAGGKQQTMEVVVPMKNPAEAVWKTYILELETTLPAIVPGHFDTIKHVEGQPFTPGSVFKVSYHQDFSHYEYIKLRWDAIDNEKFTYKLTLVDGGVLGKHFNHLCYNYKTLPNPKDGNGCVMYFLISYEDIGDHTFHDVIKGELEKKCAAIDAHISSTA